MTPFFTQVGSWRRRSATAVAGAVALGLLASCASGVGREPGIGLAQRAAEPKGFGQALTEVGLVLTDRGGLSLYLRTFSEPCTDARDPPPPPDANPLLKVYYDNFVQPSCLDQWPAVAAEAGDQAVGDWTIVKTKDGRRQWAYKGLLVHRSYKDRLPGDLSDPNGGRGFAPAVVPLNLPPGVSSRYRPGIGVIAATQQGMTLYTINPAEAPALAGQVHKVSLGCSGSCKVSVDNTWRPLPAGETAVATKPWAVLSGEDGSRAWGYHGQPVFTYVGDDAAGDIKGLARGAEPIVLYPLPKAPPGITVERTYLGPAYANAEGKTLYMFRCDVRAEGSSEFSCDNWSDNVRYREQFCVAVDRCGERWIPIYAPSTTRPNGGLWSVVTLPDRRYPFRWVPSGGEADTKPGAVKIYSYRGRPVYTSTVDLQPGEIWGHTFRSHGAGFVVVFAGEGAGG